MIFILPIIDYCMVTNTSKFKYKIISKLFERYIKSAEYTKSGHSNTILDFLQYDVKEAVQIFSWDFAVLFQALISGIGALIIMGFYSFELAITCFIISVIVTCLNTTGRNLINPIMKRKRLLWKKLTRLFSDALDNYKIVKVFHLENHVEMSIDENRKNNRDEDMKKIKFAEFFKLIESFLGNMGIYLVIIIFGCYLVNYGRLTFGSIIFCLQLSAGITFLVSSITEYLLNFQTTLYSIDRIIDFTEKHPTSIRKNEIFINSMEPVILKCENISYAYEAQHVLTNVNFTMCENKFLNIVGENGSGKSTLAKIIMKLKDDYQGNIYVCEQNIEAIEYQQYVKLIGYVPQFTDFIQGTFLENIELGYDDYEETYLNKLLEITELSQLIATKG